MSDKCGYCDSGDITCPFCKTNYSIPKWISVEERLPDPAVYAGGSYAVNVLVSVGGEVFQAAYVYGYGFSYLGVELQPTHWMPRPDPPQEE